MKKIIFILFISVFLISCKKARTIHITAKNAATGEPYSGLTYYVTTQKSIFGGTKSKTVATGELDENGEAYFTKRLSKEWGHGIRVEEPANTCYNKNIQLYFGGETNFKAEFEFAECAYLQQNIQNVNCLGVDDYMVLYSDNQIHSLINQPWEFHGCEGFLQPHYSIVPMGEYYYKWEVTRNNITNTYYDTINLSEGEYKTHEINY